MTGREAVIILRLGVEVVGRINPEVAAQIRVIEFEHPVAGRGTTLVPSGLFRRRGSGGRRNLAGRRESRHVVARGVVGSHGHVRMGLARAARGSSSIHTTRHVTRGTIEAKSPVVMRQTFEFLDQAEAFAEALVALGATVSVEREEENT